MPQLINEDELSQTFLTEDGQTVTVAKPFGQSFAPPPSMGGEIAAPGALDLAAPPPLPPDGLQGAGGPVADSGQGAVPPSMPDIPQPGPGEAPALGVPQLAPPELPPQTVAPTPAPEPAQPPPQVVPQAMPTTATQAAQLGVAGLQKEAEARQQAASAEAEGATELVQSYDVAEQRIAEQQTLKEQYQRYREKEEAQLLASKQALINRYVNHKVDRNRLFKEQSTGQNVLAAISVALSGIGGALKRDGSNPALDMVMKKLDQDVQLQLAERDQIGAAIGMKGEEIADFRSVSASRAGEYNTRMAAHLARLERDVAKIAAKTQSQTVKANAAAFTAQLQQKGAEMLGAGVTADRSYREQVRARQAAIGMQRQNLLAEMKTKGFVPDGQGGWAPDPNRPGPGLKEQLELERLRAGAAKDQAEAKLAQQKSNAGPGGTPGAVGDPTRKGAPILQADGTPWVPPTEKEQQEMRATVPAAQNVRNLADKLALAIEKYGGSSKLVGSKEYQEVVSLARTLDMEQKDIWGLGVIQGRDLEILESIRGGKDPTSFIYDAGPAIQSFADRLENRTQTRMQGMGFTGDWRPARISEAEARELTPEQNAARLTGPVPPTDSSAAGKALKEKDIERRRAAVPALLRTKPSAEKLAEWGQKVEGLRANGDISTEEAISIMNQTAPAVLQDWRAKIQKMPTSQLLKEQQNPDFRRKVTILSLLDSGSARPEEIYRLVVGQ